MAQKVIRLSKEIVGMIINLAAISALLIVITCIFINNNFTLGWFANNKNVDAGGFSVRAQDEEGFYITDYIVYRYDQDDNLQIDQDAIMRQYDTIFVARNVHNAVVFKIDIEGLGTGGTFGIRITSAPVGENDSMRYISDIVSLRAAALYVPPTDDIYDTVTTELSNGTYPAQTFHTIDENNISTRTTVVTFDSLTMPENGSVYIMMDYDPDLIGHVEVEFGVDSTMSIEYNGNITDIELFAN